MLSEITGFSHDSPLQICSRTAVVCEPLVFPAIRGAIRKAAHIFRAVNLMPSCIMYNVYTCTQRDGIESLTVFLENRSAWKQLESDSGKEGTSERRIEIGVDPRSVH